MASVVTINRPDVVALIEEVAQKMTGGNKTEAVALGLRSVLKREARTGSLFRPRPGSVWVAPGVDLTKPMIDDEFDAETGREFDR